MALQTTTAISINGTQIPIFKFLKLNQAIGGHHVLKIVCRMDVLENSDGELASVSKEFLGEVVTIHTAAEMPYEGCGELNFKGIVTSIETVKGHAVASGDQIIITATSPTFLTDDGPHYASYNDVSLSEIVTTSFEDYDTSKLSVTVAPQNDATLHYSVQQHESAFSYVNRLAKQFGEWFYYNGSELVFGAPETEEVVLKYGFDLKEYKMSLSPQSTNFKLFTKDYLVDEVIEKALSDIEPGLSNTYGQFLSEKSTNIYNKETKVWHNLYNDPQTQQRLDTVAELQKKSIAVNQFIINGISDNPGVKIGNIVVINSARYRIIGLEHTNNEIGDYINKFEGIVADIDVSPNTDVTIISRAETQIALVKENADPEGLGRIRVQFPWQEDSELTPWIRIVTPHGGLNKGFHFIPELEEEVLIGFEGGNAEKPFVFGSLFNATGKVDEFQTETNDVKVIRTRSGHTIELNDTDGEEKIKIYDNDASIITFDTQAKSLTIFATENLKLEAKNIQIIAEENIDIQAKVDLNTASEGNTAIIVKGSTTVQSTGDVDITSDGAVAIEATSDAELKGQSATVEGKTAATLKGMQTSVEGQMTAVQGASGKIDVM